MGARRDTTNRKRSNARAGFWRILTADNVIGELADRVGFEPTNPVKGLRISSAVPSTARPPVRLADQILKPVASGKGRCKPAAWLYKAAGPPSQANCGPINRSRPAFFSR